MASCRSTWTTPVKDQKTWEEDVKWRLDPTTEGRFDGCEERVAAAKAAAAQGMVITQMIGGAYMYLRSLIGPMDLLYAFYDQPDLVHACIAGLVRSGEVVTTRHQHT